METAGTGNLYGGERKVVEGDALGRIPETNSRTAPRVPGLSSAKQGAARCDSRQTKQAMEISDRGAPPLLVSSFMT